MNEVVVNDIRLLKSDALVIGFVSHIEASLNAAFIDYGADRHGFLPLNSESIDDTPRVKKGQQLIVRIVDIQVGQKGASLSFVNSVSEGESVHKLETSNLARKPSKKWQIMTVLCASLIGLYILTN
ncbi:hypothetical protein [Enterovibrio calviensis]|uniref:hypothetical protein n=1 Tax=Enterovibrio calviensis TaxID=91359 RepID=UPI0037361B2E